MYLSKLKIMGFKSFATKTQMDFNPGMSCIIGPNGSGKSNIVDSIRWVLGEQRTTALRSDKMENVIFNGTRQRKPTGMAEVSMTIDNTNNILKTEYKQVVITRRLYKSGESQYLLNNTPVRLKDIIDILMDSGLGANSYSIIELKMVESILSENRAERRLLFEEAAGVVKYKIRRKSALRKLDATRADLTRLEDIIGEIQKTVNSLSRQVGKARRYLAYTEELKNTDVELSRFRYNRLLEEIRPLKLQLEEVSKVKEASHSQITIDEALLEDYKRELIRREQELQELNLKLQEIDTRIAELNKEQAVSETKTEEIGKNRQRFLQEISDLQQKIKIMLENLDEFQKEYDELLEQKESVESRYSEVENERRLELEKLQDEKKEIVRLNQSFRSQLNALSSQKEEFRQKKYQLDFNNEQLSELQEKIGLYKLASKDLKKARQQISAKKETLTNEEKTVTEKIKTLQDIRKSGKEKLATAYEEKNKALAELETFRSRKQFFEQIIGSYEGHSKSAQFVMNKKDSLHGIHGTIADILSVDEKYALALETILGDTLNFILVDSLSDAKDVIRLVKEEKKGRITLIPMDQLKSIAEQKVLEADVDFITTHIQFDKQYDRLMHLLLGDAALASDLEEAVSLSKQYPWLRFITPEGETVNFNREIAGGSNAKKGASVIGRKDQLKKYSKLIREAEQKLEALQDTIAALQEEEEQNNRKTESLTAEATDIRNQLVEQDKQEHQLLYEVNKMQETRAADDARKIQISQDISNLEVYLKELEAKVENGQQALNGVEKETIKRTNEYESKSETLQLLTEEVQKARLNVSTLQNRLSNRKSDIERTNASVKEMNAGIRRREKEIEQIDELVVKLKNGSEQRAADKIRIWEDRDRLDSQKEHFEQNLQEIRDKITDIEQQTKTYRKQHDSSLETSRTLELRISENRVKAENLREYVLKEYAQDLEIGIPYEDFNVEEAEEKIETLRERIKHLGPVNPLAVSEYDKEKERLDFLSAQRDDLLKAEKMLLETIDKINKTARSQFLETYEAIKTNFEKVFKSFFENGEGSLSMDTNEDPLEADIEINVRTKGKRPQTLSLLSGGEKTLTAISLLFAIYLVKPSPFCILDEVDAPLDDVNISRFTQALQNFSEKTQFIIITHNKRTMEASSTMYGVTMEEEGVSKLVSVKFT